MLGSLDTEATNHPTGTSVTSMVRPDDLHFVPTPDGDDTVVSSEYRGSGWLLAVELLAGPTVLVTTSHLQTLEPGTRGRVSLVPGHRQVPVGDDLPNVGAP